jgi:hypothetical protein
MIRNVSADSLFRLKKLACSSYSWIVVSKTEAFDELLEWLSLESSITSEFRLLTCNQPKRNTSLLRVKFDRPWSASQYVRFTRGKAAEIPDSTPSLYGGDGPRKPTHYADSYFGRYGVEFPTFLKRVLRSTVLGRWLVHFLVRQFSQLRPRYICAEYSSPTQSRILVSSDSTIEKDHYGENPLLKMRLYTLRQAIYAVCLEGRIPVIFIDVGPRWLYLRCIRRLLRSMGEKQKGAHLIVTGGYREMDRHECERMGLTFYRGSNVNAYGAAIYSQHCLEIGAGLHEVAIGYIQ